MGPSELSWKPDGMLEVNLHSMDLHPIKIHFTLTWLEHRLNHPTHVCTTKKTQTY